MVRREQGGKAMEKKTTWEGANVNIESVPSKCMRTTTFGSKDAFKQNLQGPYRVNVDRHILAEILAVMQ